MTANRNCPACSSPLPADAPAGLCPRCLLAGGFATAASPSTADFEPPTVAELAPLFPQLEIIELLGAGGMGAVYKARQPRLDRIVALKVLPPNDDPSFAERFTREARALAKLNHPGIVQVYDFGQAGGHSYIVMEFVEGVNLRQAERAGTMTSVEALAVVPQICSALQFAHEAGVVHRDIKPENVLIDAKGRVKIADFGLAKLLGVGEPHHLTGTHQAMGTMHYMAPEQWEKPATVDHRADIYSLGVVFYELLTGELPLGRFAPPSEKVQVDVRLDQVVLRALEKEPERRYQQASDVKTDVENIAAKPAPVAPPIPPPLQRSWTASRVIAWLAILASIVIWPFGMVAFPVACLVSYTQKRSIAIVSVYEDAVLFLGLHRIATWMVIICFLGVAHAFLPWGMLGDVAKIGEYPKTLEYFFGFDYRFEGFPAMIPASFLVLGLFLFVSARLPRMQLWRALSSLVGGAVLAVFIPVFLHVTANRGWNQVIFVALSGGFPPGKTLWISSAPFGVAGLAIALMILGAIELRGYLVNRSALPAQGK